MSLLAATGRQTLGALTSAKGTADMVIAAVTRTVRRPREGGRAVRAEIVRQILFTGVEGLLVTSVLALLIGAMTTAQMLALIGGPSAQGLLGQAMRILIVRELGPLLAALIVVARTASAVTVDLGNLVQRGEIGALEALGIDPLRYLVLPRLAGIVISTVALCVVFDLYAIVGGATAARELVGFPVAESIRTVGAAVSRSDLALGLGKAVAFGTLVGAICTHEGLSAGTSALEIPRATRRSVLGSLVGCVVLDALATLVTLR